MNYITLILAFVAGSYLALHSIPHKRNVVAREPAQESTPARASSTPARGGQAAVATLVDYLRGTPASVNGVIQFGTRMPLYSGRVVGVPVGVRVNGGTGIGFEFDENRLSIFTGAGLSLTIAGIPIKVTGINYQASTGRFQVTTETPLRIGEGLLNGEMEKVLNDLYKDKMVQALEQLRQLRRSQNLHDMQQVSRTIAGIFTPPDQSRSTPLPTINGHVQLTFRPSEDRQLQLDQFQAHLRGNDRITTRMEFINSTGPGGFQVKAVQVTSERGIRIHGQTSVPEIASVNFRQARADGSGVNFDYDVGAEEVISAFRLILGVVAAASSNNPNRILEECDPVRIRAIRNILDANLRRELANMIRQHRDKLLAGGASPQLLAGLLQ